MFFKNAGSVYSHVGISEMENLKQEIPSGVYNVSMTFSNVGNGLLFKPLNAANNVVQMKNGIIGNTVKYASRYFSKETSETCNALGMAHRMGILIHGPHGTGKSTLAYMIALKLVESVNAVAINCTNLEIRHTEAAIETLREHQDNLIIVLIDEVDKFMAHREEEMLTMLDSFSVPNKVLFLATTNYLNKIPERFRCNRPSRFGKVIEVENLEYDVYHEFITGKLANVKHNISTEGLAMACEQHGINIDELKHILIDMVVNGTDLETVTNKYKSV